MADFFLFVLLILLFSFIGSVVVSVGVVSGLETFVKRQKEREENE